MKDLALNDQEHKDLYRCLQDFDSVVFKGYLDVLEYLPVKKSEMNLKEAINNIRLKKICRIVYDKDEDNQDKFNNVLSAMHSIMSSVVILLKGSNEGTDVYIGTNKRDSSAGNRGNEAFQTLESALQGNFPGLKLSENLYAEDLEQLLSPISGSELNAVASVTGVPSLKNDEKGGFCQGIEKLIDGMRGRKYTAVILAEPISRHDLERIEAAYQQIYSTLSVFEQRQITLSENESIALGKSLTEGVTKTLTTTTGETVTHTEGTNYTRNVGSSVTRSDWDVKKVLTSMPTGAVAGATAGSIIPGAGNLAGAIIGAGMGIASGILGGSKTRSNSEAWGENQSQSNAYNDSRSESEARNQALTDSETATTGMGKSVQVTQKNRTVQTLLKKIDDQLGRIVQCRNYGMWSWGGYFLSSGMREARLGADIYSGILRGESTGLERSRVSTWKRHVNKSEANPYYQDIASCIAQLRHPLFVPEGEFISPALSATSLISTREMSVAMGLPQKSVQGIPVLDSVSFGRSVTSLQASEEKKKLVLGSIYHLGSVEPSNPVELEIDALTSHAFITGSTGSGKSNTIYGLLNRLKKNHQIPFLVIEPAKGEYKHIFGGMDGVNVFGTNPYKTPLLRINPFSFPEGIHIVEHIDRLIEILNAVWPMYAAMPAILKSAVEKAYEIAGWDLLTSTSCYSSPGYPDFHDLLCVLPEIINQSDYSDEFKGNYSGALITRVNSLTNGYYRSIFQKTELPLNVLFDQCCIVDLSQVGSSETKALLMGVLFLKLQEYRMATSQEFNSGLKHITVLEEAHNLLRRTSSEQSSEGANLQGKSVEMLSNAIAEMRTYGESFIVSDQAPGLLDPSVIRNTNTKIILRLPDYEDRNLVGKAANLNDEQIIELARLPTGCAAVFQNKWLEPVLCQINKFEMQTNGRYQHNPTPDLFKDERKEALTERVKTVLAYSLKNEGERLAEPLKLPVSEYYPVETTLNSHTEISQYVCALINLPKVLDNVRKDNDLDRWLGGINSELDSLFLKEKMNEVERIELMSLILNVLSVETPHNKPFFEEKMNEMRHSVGRG